MHPSRPATQGNQKGRKGSRSLEEIEERRPLARLRGLCRGEAAARNHVSVCRRRREGDKIIIYICNVNTYSFPTNLHIFYCYHFQNLGAGGARRRRGGGGGGRVPLLRPPPPVPHPAAEPLPGAAGVARGRVRLRAGGRVSQEGGGGGGEGRIIAGGGGGILQDDGGREVRDNFLTE